MLRYKTQTRPGLVAVYDIRPGNEAGLFLQPRSLHGAQNKWENTHKHWSLVHSVKLRHNRQKITFHGSANPKEISQQYTPTTHTEAVHCQTVLLGVFHPCLWPLEAPASILGEGRQKVSTRCPLFFNIDFPRLFHDQKMKIHDQSAQHIFPSKRYTTYECIPELVVTVPSACSTIVKEIKPLVY